MPDSIQFTVNMKPVSLAVDGERKLLWVLRTELQLTGAKYGCGSGFCGACTVLVDGRALHACQTPVKDVAGKDVLTIEGLAAGEKLHPLQRQFIEHGALQCGFCTPGMILRAHALLLQNPRATREEIAAGMEGHLCRCAAHKRILEAIEAVAVRG